MPGFIWFIQILKICIYISKQFDAYGEHPIYFHDNGKYHTLV